MKATKNPLSILFVALFHITLLFRGNCVYGQNLGSQVREMVKAHDYSGIQAKISAEEQSYSTKPSVSHFDRMLSIAVELGSADRKTQQYWIFRKVVWQALLDPLPPMSNPEEPKHVFAQKETLLRCVIHDTFGPSRGFYGVIDPDMRHDAALLLLSYANWIKPQIVPDNMYKAVAPINADPKDIEATRQNAVYNNIQDELRNALGIVQNGFTSVIADAYYHKPQNPYEARELVDGLNIQGNERKHILTLASQENGQH